MPGPASEWSGFHRLPREARLRKLGERTGLSADALAALSSGTLSPALAETFVENAVGAFPLPLGVAVHFRVDGRDVVVPMAVEESSVIAAAGHGAKLALGGGGFRTKAGPFVTIGQVELLGIRSQGAAVRAITRAAPTLRRRLDKDIPRMVARGGGVRRIEPRNVGKGRVVVHLHIDTKEAMGANVVNSVCEAAAPELARLAGGTPGLRILTNLALGRLVTASCRVPSKAVGGVAGVRGILAAQRLAELDPFRAATHNKGILNGMDPVAVATGNDWRALEAGAHSYAAMKGHYGPLTTWKRGPRGDLVGTLTAPIQVGTVGGVTRLHPVAAACLRLMGDPDVRRLAGIIASVGLAQNLAALRALSQEGIQAGHMRLHAANLALAAKA